MEQTGNCCHGWVLLVSSCRIPQKPQPSASLFFNPLVPGSATLCVRTAHVGVLAYQIELEHVEEIFLLGQSGSLTLVLNLINLTLCCRL